MKIEAENGFSLLHLAAFKKFSNDFEAIILARIMKQCSDRKQIVEYINRKTNNEDGYTPLHLAGYYGNFICIRYLISEGADV